MDDGWIVIPNWDRFQHYKDRDPVWIKMYTNLPDKYEWQRLSFADRGVLVTAWLAYASSNGVLHVSRMRALCGRYANRYANIDKALKRLSDAGFVELVASKPLAQRQRQRREEAFASKPKKKNPEPAAINMPARDEAAYVRKLIANHIITEPFELDAYNLDDALRRELRQLL